MTFKPTQVKTYSGDLTVSSNKTSGTNTKWISGTGVQVQYTLTTSPSPSSSYGYVTPSGGTYPSGTQVTITAHENDCYDFDEWGVDASGTSTSVTVTMNSNKNVIAYFVNADLLAPTGVDATDGDYTDKVRITWESDSCASYHRVYRANSSGGTPTALSSWQTSTTFYDTSADFCWVYSYWVKSATSSSGANASPYSSRTTGWRRLEAPQNVEASFNLVGKTVISWDPVDSAVYYKVYRGLSTGSPVAITGYFTTTSYEYTVDREPGDNNCYWYWVRAAYNTSGTMDSSLSAFVNGCSRSSCDAPENVQASDGASGIANSVYVTWDLVDGATHYYLAKSGYAGGTKYSVSGWIKDYRYYDPAWECTPGQNYYYYVMAATSSTGQYNSSFSDYGIGYAIIYPPSLVTGNFNLGGNNMIEWNSVDGANYYRVYRASSVSGYKYPQTDWISHRYFEDESVTSGDYYYWVKASHYSDGTNASGYSDWVKVHSYW